MVDKQGRKCGSAEGDVKTDHISAKCHPYKPKWLRIKAMCKEEKETILRRLFQATSAIINHFLNNVHRSSHMDDSENKHGHHSCISIRR